MSSTSWLAKQVTLSPTRALSILRPKGGIATSTLVQSLMLTSLIDAFSILVIFLLMNTSNSMQEFEMQIMGGLPMASNTDGLKKGVVLVVENNVYKLNGSEIRLDQLASALKAEKIKIEEGMIVKKADLIIQASKGADYESLSPILVAASQAEFQNYKLAVVEINR